MLRSIATSVRLSTLSAFLIVSGITLTALSYIGNTVNGDVLDHSTLSLLFGADQAAKETGWSCADEYISNNPNTVKQNDCAGNPGKLCIQCGVLLAGNQLDNNTTTPGYNLAYNIIDCFNPLNPGSIGQCIGGSCIGSSPLDCRYTIENHPFQPEW